MNKIVKLLNSAMCECYTEDQWNKIFDLFYRISDDLDQFLEMGYGCIQNTMEDWIATYFENKYDILFPDLYLTDPKIVDEFIQLNAKCDEEMFKNCLSEFKEILKLYLEIWNK